MKIASEIVFFLRLLASSRDRAYALRWWRGRRSDFALSAGLPWIVFPAIDFLEQRDLRGARVFEYGSGGSTRYWLRKDAAHVVSIEHDAHWFFTMQKNVGSPALDLRLVEPERDPSAVDADRADPQAFVSDDPGFLEHRFTRYVEQIDEFPDASFDVVLVDGRARPSCIAHAAPKVKRCGLLIVDNADRDYYLRKTATILGDFSQRIFEGPAPGAAVLSATAIFTRER